MISCGCEWENDGMGHGDYSYLYDEFDVFSADEVTAAGECCSCGCDLSKEEFFYKLPIEILWECYQCEDKPKTGKICGDDLGDKSCMKYEDILYCEKCGDLLGCIFGQGFCVNVKGNIKEQWFKYLAESGKLSEENQKQGDVNEARKAGLSAVDAALDLKKKHMKAGS